MPPFDSGVPSSWLKALRDGFLTAESYIPNMDQISEAAKTAPDLMGLGIANIGRGIDAASQVARPIGAVAGAIGNIQSEAGLEEAERGVQGTAGRSNVPSVMEGAQVGADLAPETARKTINALDVASVGTGMAPGRAMKVADLALAGVDAAMGGAHLAKGVEEGDPMEMATGAFRVAGNLAGGLNSVKELRGLGKVAPPEGFKVGAESQSDIPLIDQILGKKDAVEKLRTEHVGKDTSGAPYSVETHTVNGNSSFLTREHIRSMKEDPHVQEAVAEQMTLLRMADAEEADTLVSGLSDITGGDPSVEYQRSGNARGVLTGSQRRGMSYTGVDRENVAGGGNPYWFNPWNIAKDAQKFVETALSGDVHPMEANKLLSTLSPEDAEYVMKARQGLDYSPARELQIKANQYVKQLLYTGAHERTLHIDKGSGHNSIPGEDYRTNVYDKSGKPVYDTTHLTAQEPMNQFDEAHNWWLEQMQDPEAMKGIKGIIEGPNFEARALEWYKAMNPADVPTDMLPDMKVAVRHDRVVGRVEAVKAAKEIERHKIQEIEDLVPDQSATPPGSSDGEGYVDNPRKLTAAELEDNAEALTDTPIGPDGEGYFEGGRRPPTPPGSVPPGSSGGGSMGPELPSLAKRIKETLRNNLVVGNQNKMKMRELNDLKAQALRDNEAKLASQMINVEDFHAERKKILSQDYGLINKVQEMPISEAEKFQMSQTIAQQSNDDAFARNRAQAAFEKMIKGDRLEANEIKSIREVIGERMKINEEDPAIIKIGKFFANTTGSARAIMTAYDLSAAGRQALYAAPMNPGAVKESFKAQVQALRMSRNEFKSFMAKLQDPAYNPFAEISKAAGLHFSETMDGASGKMEENFYNGKWAEKLPGVRQSEQAYIAYLNKMRVELFNKHAAVMKAAGEEFINPETGAASQKLQDLAYMVNTLTGRGELSLLHMSPNSPMGKKFGLKETLAPGKDMGKKAHEALTTVFFAPRFAASRAALMRDTVQALVGGGLDPAISKVYMKNVIGTVTAVTSTMAALAAMGVGTFNSDPRKKDFGVLKVGNTRYDAYGGLKPWAKIVSVMGTDQYFSGKYNLPKQYGQGMGAKTRTGELGRFAQGKLSPAAGFLLEAVTGEDFMGRKSQLWRNTYEHSFPMILQTIAESIEANEADQLPLAVPLSLVGVGVNSYSDARFKKGSR